MVIAPHGAGLTNLVFSRGAKVLELISIGHGMRPEFFQLTMITGGEYHFHVFAPVNERNDFIVPKPIIEKHLGTLLE